MVEATVDILMDQIASRRNRAEHSVIAGELIVRTSARLPKTGIVEIDGQQALPARRSMLVTSSHAEIFAGARCAYECNISNCPRIA